VIIESQAPVRLDLSGGTLDIWPLYLFHQHSITINVAINLFAKVKLKTRKDQKITIKSLDLNQEAKADSIKKLAQISNFDLFKEVISFFNPPTGLNIISYCQAPMGSGLGSSSALMIAFLGALNHLLNKKYKPHELISLGKNLEAKLLKASAGEQDFYPALYGGLNCLHLRADGIKKESITIEPEELENRLILCYSGISRLSGKYNWNIVKMHIDGDKHIFDIFEQLRDISLSMSKSLRAKNYKKIGQLFNKEWEARKKLPGKISSEKILSLRQHALTNGALAAKICGAGGGGCLLFWTEPKNKKTIIESLKNAGAQILPFKISFSGLEIKEV
jgi:D-glycero-alpha-D-manno-heptose-7-phosphate kinase